MLGCLQSCAAAVCIHISQYSPTALHGASKKFAWQLVLLAIGHLQQSVKVTVPKNQQLTILHLEIFCLLRLDRNLYTIPRSPASSACCGNKPDYMNEIEYQSILFLFSLDGSKLHLREKGQQRRWPWKGSERQVSTSNAFSPHLRRSHRWVANHFQEMLFSFFFFPLHLQKVQVHWNVSLVWSSHDIFLFRSLIWKWHWLVRGVVGSLHWPPESLQGDLIKWQIQINDTVQAIHNGVLSSAGGNLHQGPQCVWAGGIQYPLSTLITGPWNSLSSSLGMVTSISFDIIVLLINIDYHT